jgi:biopolymer transport protein ExbD
MRQRRVEEKIETPMTSMIDVVFLLIIFFVVTSAIEKEVVDSSIELAKSYYVPPPEKRDPRTITVNVKYINDSKYVVSIANSALSKEYLGGLLRNSVAKYGNDFPVVIRADGRTKYKQIDEIVAIVGQSGLYRVQLASLDQDKR